MRLIAEAGATKIQWAIINSSEIFKFATSGFNPNVADRNYLRQLLLSGFPQEFNPDEITEIIYYGAGCSSVKNKAEVNRALSNFFIHSESIIISSDLEAVGRAVFANGQGLVGILGTGSSFGYYSNYEILFQAPSLGYLLGDEGSGAYIGKVFLNKLMGKHFSTDLEQQIFSQINKNSEQIMQELYKSKVANAYLASFLPVVNKFIDYPDVYLIIEQAFQAYVDFTIQPMQQSYPNEKIGIVGGVASHFSDVLKIVFSNNSLPTPEIIERPFELILQQQKD